jgi:hypothetical protein
MIDNVAKKYLDYDFNEYVFIKLANDIMRLVRCYMDS